MNRSQRKKEPKMNKLIFASLLSVGAILAAQTPAAAGRAGRRQQDHCLFESEDQQEASQ